LGRLTRALAYLSFCGLMSSTGELRLGEAEPDGWFLLIVGAKLDLRGRCRRDGLNIARMRHVCERTKEGAAQATEGEFQEETRNREATVRIQQQEQMFTGKK
jgi:hypothetical protein